MEWYAFLCGLISGGFAVYVALAVYRRWSRTLGGKKTPETGAERVIVTARTYRKLQERVRVAEQLLASEVDHAANTREWALAAFAEQRRLSDRLVLVYGEARAAGCTAEQLAGPQ